MDVARYFMIRICETVDRIEGRPAPALRISCRRAPLIGTVLAICALCSAPVTARQIPHFRRPPSQHAAIPNADPVAMDLLHKMVAPSAPYAGEQVTERRGAVSHQRVEGDERGRVRMDFRDPAQLSGDVMLISPHRFRNFHRSTNTVDIALWPSHRDPVEGLQRLLGALRHGRIVVQRTGDQVIAGRSAVIVQISPAGADLGREGRQYTFWIDPATGIKLKQEVTGPHGLISRSSFTSIVVGPQANVSPKDFEPAFVQTAQPNLIFPPNAQEFGSMDAARPLLPFVPQQPASVPAGFKVAHVWVFPDAGPHDHKHGPGPSGDAHTAVLIRYSNGLEHFNLYEHLARAHPQRPHSFHSPDSGPSRRSVQRWRVTMLDGRELEIVYIGVLPHEQTELIHNSLR